MDEYRAPGSGKPADAGTTWMTIESPGQSAILPSSFLASGWALDRAARSGTGVDAVQLWAYPNLGSGEAPLFLGNADYGVDRSDVGLRYGGQFAASGFTLSVSGLRAGSYRVFAFARNVATGAYTAYLGYGETSKVHPRLPRLPFNEACSIL